MIKFQNIAKLLILASFLFITSCDKDNTSQAEVGKVSAKVNGLEWVADDVRGEINGDQISFGGYITESDELGSYRTESMSFRIVPTMLKQKLLNNIHYTPNAIFVTHIEHGESTNDWYEVLGSDSDESWLQIDEEMSDYGRIRGRFEMVLVKVKDGIDPPTYPDTLHITEGTFDVTLTPQ